MHRHEDEDSSLTRLPELAQPLLQFDLAAEIEHLHRADGRISIQTIVGHVRLKLPQQTVEVPAGHLLALDRCITHDVEAVEESVFLLTICWPEDAA